MKKILKWFENLFQNQNNKALEKFIGRVSSSAEVEEKIEEAVAEAQETGEPLPENIQKVVEFINETGGSLSDYVRLNQNYDDMDDTELLNEYFKQTKPHLNDEERLFVMEDLYSYNEE